MKAQLLCLTPLLFILRFLAPHHVFAQLEIPIKIVDGPILSFDVGNSGPPVGWTVVTKRPPSPFSGPPQLSRLQGTCFSKVVNDFEYEYKFCPFANVTQHELGNPWNPYRGVLGIYEQWEIEDNTFVAMWFSDGDSCGDKDRKVKVSFHCGTEDVISSVTEVSPCRYQIVFSTNLVCHPDSMLVYPTLNDTQRQQWNYLLGDLAREEITDKVYSESLSAIFQQAGLLKHDTYPTQGPPIHVTKPETTQKPEVYDPVYRKIYKMAERVRVLEDDVRRLTQLLADGAHCPKLGDTQLERPVTGAPP